MFKKLTALLLVLCVLFCFAACNNEPAANNSNTLSSAASVGSQSLNNSQISSLASNVSSALSSVNTSSVDEQIQSNPSSTISSKPQSQNISSTTSTPGCAHTYVNDKCTKCGGVTNLRIMSYNVLNPIWCSTSDYVPVEGRVQLVRDIILDYMPDVIGLQEAESSWHNALDKYLCSNGTYKFACKYSNGGACNMTTFLYNSKTVKLVDEYIVDLDTNSEIRVFAVAVFKRLSDGTRFVVTNTHPAPPSQEANYERNFSALLKSGASEVKKYKSLPVIMTGDFNTKEQVSQYNQIMSYIGVKDAKYEAKTLVKDYCTFSGLNVLPKKGNSYCIDHIFVNSNLSVKQFDTVIDHSVEKASDHIPIYADITLK